MRQERIKKKVERPRERVLDLSPLSTREIFYPYPVRRDPRPQPSR